MGGPQRAPGERRQPRCQSTAAAGVWATRRVTAGLGEPLSAERCPRCRRRLQLARQLSQCVERQQAEPWPLSGVPWRDGQPRDGRRRLSGWHREQWRVGLWGSEQQRTPRAAAEPAALPLSALPLPGSHPLSSTLPCTLHLALRLILSLLARLCTLTITEATARRRPRFQPPPPIPTCRVWLTTTPPLPTCRIWLRSSTTAAAAAAAATSSSGGSSSSSTASLVTRDGTHGPFGRD